MTSNAPGATTHRPHLPNPSSMPRVSSRVMGDWLRRLRGALGIGAVWGAAGSIVGALGAVAGNLFVGTPLLASMIDFGLGAGFAGFLLGTGFAGILTLVERRRTLEELSATRAGLWGAVAGAVVPAGVLILNSAMGWNPAIPLQQLFPVVLGASTAYALLTGVLAAGTVSIAKRTPEGLPPGVEPNSPNLLGR